MIHAYYETQGRRYCQVDVLGKVCDILSSMLNGDIRIFNSAEYRVPNDTRNRYAPWNLSLENPDTKKYFLISYMDYLNYIYLHENFDLPNLVEIFATVGLHENIDYYTPTEIIATPISNTCGHQITAMTVEECYRRNDVEKFIHEKPTFFGCLYTFREFLTNDDRFNVQKSFLPFKEYIEDLHRQKLCFSINGGEISPRDVEIMGLGNALFRTKLRTTKTHNPLIPNYHYISVEIDGIPETDLYSYYKELSDRIIDRYDEVKKDEEFIEFVSKNGRKWYEENGTVDACANIIYNLLDLSKLE